MSNKIISASISSLSKIIPFMKDPLVRKELSRLARDKSNAHILRAQFQIWLGAKAKNLIENGSLEKPFPMVQPIWSSRLAGERSTKFASDGKYSFCARNGYFRFRPAVRPRKTYLFLCDIYMEKGSNEGRFTFQLGPCKGKIPKDWRGEKDQILTGGSWNTYSCVIPTGAAVDNIDIQLWFRYFEQDERIYFDNVRLYDLEELK